MTDDPTQEDLERQLLAYFAQIEQDDEPFTDDEEQHYRWLLYVVADQ